MPPAHRLKGAHLLSRVEEYLLPSCAQNDDCIVQLFKPEVINIEGAFLAIDHLHGVSGQPGSAQHGQVKLGDLLAGAALLRPGIFGVLGVLQTELFQLRLALLAGIVGVVQRLNGFVELLCLIQIAVARSDESRDSFTDALRWLREVIHVLGP